jgi:CRISPR-associated protein Cmr6
MPNIRNITDKIPMLFRAQVDGRCQLQRLQKGQEPDIVRWTAEWIQETYPNAPDFSGTVQSRTYTINWRFVSNGGQDDSIIRPAIGARGWPVFPGSSMKGVFRRACSSQECDRYCGNERSSGEFEPGILRFHGGYPTSTAWTDGLVDIVHPQQDWQVKTNDKAAGAFAQISLYQPEFQFGLSSTEPLEQDEWQRIWEIWETALAHGIGCRVSAGYGQPENLRGDLLYRTNVKGQGQAPKLFNGDGEFRPNMFRAAIRGHALRIFGGLTDARTADGLVEDLFGGVSGNGTVGRLQMTFQTKRTDPDTFGQRAYQQPTYDIEGTLSWLQAYPVEDDEQRQALKKLIRALTRFAVQFGGFGKSWRRADHRLFYPSYYDQGAKPLIGCHWQWVGKALERDAKVKKPAHVPLFIDEVRKTAQDWMQLCGVPPNPANKANWRETWHPDTVEVWGRIADDELNSEAIRWFHEPYLPGTRKASKSQVSIYKSPVTGGIGQVSRLWHRMYPLPTRRDQYLELLTVFPDQSEECGYFLGFLDSEPFGFKKLWPRL